MYPFVEVIDLKSVTVKILRVWENTTPDAHVERDPIDDSHVLDNSGNQDLEHFFANELDAPYKI